MSEMHDGIEVLIGFANGRVLGHVCMLPSADRLTRFESNDDLVLFNFGAAVPRLTEFRNNGLDWLGLDFPKGDSSLGAINWSFSRATGRWFTKSYCERLIRAILRFNGAMKGDVPLRIDTYRAGSLVTARVVSQPESMRAKVYLRPIHVACVESDAVVSSLLSKSGGPRFLSRTLCIRGIDPHGDFDVIHQRYASPVSASRAVEDIQRLVDKANADPRFKTALVPDIQEGVLYKVGMSVEPMVSEEIGEAL